VTSLGVPWWGPSSGAAAWTTILFWVALVAVAVSFLQTALVLASALRRRERPATGNESDFLWVFLVPALNEEVTIADSVARLAAVEATHKVIVVIDDGSDDATAEILAGLACPGLRVLTRRLPEARHGKAAALNAAYTFVRQEVLAEAEYAEFGAANTIVGVVDADGRLDAEAPGALAEHFADPRVGGAQVLVRIYNRHGLLTRAQDLEFGVFGHVMQAGRSRWGSANMGGNGQFNRLAALADVATARGPWRDRLTEDQDLGVRLVQRGWRSVQENQVSVHQQGLSSLRRLYRQRTRWAQGAWQAVGLAGSLHGMRRGGRHGCAHGLRARLDARLYLLTPLLQLIVGGYLLFDALDAAVTQTDPVPVHRAILAILLLPTLSGFLPALAVSVVRLRGGVRAGGETLLAGLLYPLYTWLLLPTVMVSLVRQLTGATGWAKTARVPLAGTVSGG